MEARSSFTTVLPEDQRLSRVALEALARRYFRSLSTHHAVLADFDTNCNRYHSGKQITNVARNTVEGGRQEHALAPWREPRRGAGR